MKQNEIVLYIEEAKKGSDRAFRKLAKHYHGLIYKMMEKYYFNGMDENDAFQFALFSMHQGIQTFDKTKSNNPDGYLKHCLTRGIQRAVSVSNQKRFQSINEGISMNQTYLDHKNVEFGDVVAFEYGNSEDPAEQIEKEESEKEINALLERVLTKKEKMVFELRLAGYSYKEMESFLNISRKAIDNCLYRAKQKLKEEMEVGK